MDIQSEILSYEELVEITGYKSIGFQRRWLEEHLWHYVESRRRRPLVGRDYARMKLGVPFPTLSDQGPVPATPAWSPDFSKVS